MRTTTGQRKLARRRSLAGRRTSTVVVALAVAASSLAGMSPPAAPPARPPTRGGTSLVAALDLGSAPSPYGLGVRTAAHQVPREVTISSPKGTRVWTASAMSDRGLPVAAERAYRNAARAVGRTDPGCELPWTLLAGIGRVESDHGRYDGRRLGADGISRPRVIGVPLNGIGPVAAIRDTDDGRLDRDRTWDRAVGPMQFIPSTWAGSAKDGDGDGVRSPHDLDDAALAAASYLCGGAGSLRHPAIQATAVYRYNQDDYYVALVQAFEVGYRTGVFVMPSPPQVEVGDGEPARVRRARPAPGRREARDGEARRVTRSPASRPASGAGRGRPAATPARPVRPAPGSSTPSRPQPTAQPTAEPTSKPTNKPAPAPPPAAEPPPPAELVGVLAVCDGGHCLGGKPLDLGDLTQGSAPAAGDFDGDGTVESNGAELTGMTGTEVSMVVVALPGGVLQVQSIRGIALR